MKVRRCGILLFFFYINCFAQSEKTKDSLNFPATKIEANYTAKDRKSVAYDALAPAKAAFYSAIIPGLGQAYSKKYWKIPIIYGALGTSIGIALWNQKFYDRYRTAYKNRQLKIFTDPYLGATDAALVRAQEGHEKNRDIAILTSVAFYVLNIIDANVTAHLRQFNLNNNLSIVPKIEWNEMYPVSDYKLSVSYSF